MCDCSKIESVDKIVFTKRHFEVFSRWLTVQYETSLKEIDEKKCIDFMGEDEPSHPYRSMNFKNIEILLNPEYPEEDGDTHIEIYITFKLCFCDKSVCNCEVEKINFGCVVDSYQCHTKDYEYAIKELEKLIGSQYIKCKDLYCQCLKSSFSEYCNSCYIYFTEIEDKCPICLTNQGRFIKPECGHIIHFHCYHFMPGNKCPLCREIINNWSHY